MNNILLVSEISNYKDIGKKIDEDKLTPIITQAQIIDLKNILGDRFYFDVINNKDNKTYQPLLEGCAFTYNTIEYFQDGLKSILADYFQSKYVLQINVNFTPFGVTSKSTQDSEPVDRNTLKDIATQQIQLAAAKWEITQLYLNSNPTLFTQWKNNIYNSDTNTQVSERIFKFRKI